MEIALVILFLAVVIAIMYVVGQKAERSSSVFAPAPVEEVTLVSTEGTITATVKARVIDSGTESGIDAAAEVQSAIDQAEAEDKAIAAAAAPTKAPRKRAPRKPKAQ